MTQKDYREQKAVTPRVQFMCSACTSVVQQPDAESTRLSVDQTIPYSEVTIPYTDDEGINHSSFDITRQSFTVPEESAELSIEDDPIEQVTTLEAEETFTVVDSGTQRSKRKLVSSHGYTFTLKRQNTNSTEWRCSVRNKRVTCPVVVVQRGDSYTTQKFHQHASKPGILTSVKIAKEVY